MLPMKGFNIECYYQFFDELVVVGAHIRNSCLGTSNPDLPPDEQMNDSLHRRKSCVGAFLRCAKVHPLLHEIKLGREGVGGPKVVCLRRHNYATLFHSFMGVDSRDMTHHFPLFLDAFEMGPTFSLIPYVCLHHLTNRAQFQIFISQTQCNGRKNMLIFICPIPHFQTYW